MTFTFTKIILSAMLICMLSANVFAQTAKYNPLTLWYDSPAKSAMNDALPIGGGKLGALVFGIPQAERLVLNEISLWSGTDNPSGSYEDWEGMGTYQQLGELLIQLPGHDQYTNYKRDLDISQALAHVTYTSGDIQFTREIFASHVDGVMIVHLTANKPGSYTGTIALNDARKNTTTATGNQLSFAGQLSNGMKYDTQLLAVASGGIIKANSGILELTHANEVTLIISAGTSYIMDAKRNYQGEDPHASVATRIQSASRKTYESLKTSHIADYQSLFDRVTFDIGRGSDEQRAMTTNVRKDHASKKFDPEMEELLFQYGRYLLISCSRPGGLPSNLQGLWCDGLKPAWHSDYHSNINIQMNYWLAEVSNLSECHTTFFDLVTSQLEPWRKATAVSNENKTPSNELTKRGFAIRTSHNITGGLGWQWDRTANAWYGQHFWEHYAFTQDKNYLRKVAYPYLKEVTEFWEDHLKELPDGKLVVPNAWSPEHGPHEDGVSYAQEIVYDLFTHYIAASNALGMDKVYAAKITSMRDKLAMPRIGSWGQLMEWMDEKPKGNKDNLDSPEDHHRHTSHLFGVFPGSSITIGGTPKLADAAKVSLIARGSTGDVREWSFAWRTALWARLRDAEQAHDQIMHLLADRNTCVNLFGLHPPMQIDGNFGITAGIAEMLIQSQEVYTDPVKPETVLYILELLPAIPKDWATGSVKGLRTRGGFEVDLAWKDHQLTGATIHNIAGTGCKVRYGGKLIDIKIPPGKSMAIPFNG